jgi:hypothetical protein
MLNMCEQNLLQRWSCETTSRPGELSAGQRSMKARRVWEARNRQSEMRAEHPLPHLQLLSFNPSNPLNVFSKRKRFLTPS